MVFNKLLTAGLQDPWLLALVGLETLLAAYDSESGCWPTLRKHKGGGVESLLKSKKRLNKAPPPQGWLEAPPLCMWGGGVPC